MSSTRENASTEGDVNGRLLEIVSNLATCGKGDGPVSLDWLHPLIDRARAVIATTEGRRQTDR